MSVAPVLAAALLAATAAPMAPAGLGRCQAPAPGRYALLGSGQQNGEPSAVLMQERWLADGRLEGVRYRRLGRRFSEDRYSGVVKADPHCWAVASYGGRLQQRDALGTSYDYRVVVLSGGAGYFYLQTDPDDLTLGLLQRLR